MVRTTKGLPQASRPFWFSFSMNIWEVPPGFHFLLLRLLGSSEYFTIWCTVYQHVRLFDIILKLLPRGRLHETIQEGFDPTHLHPLPLSRLGTHARTTSKTGQGWQWDLRFAESCHARAHDTIEIESTNLASYRWMHH